MCLPNLHLPIGIDPPVDSANYNVSVVRVTAYVEEQMGRYFKDRHGGFGRDLRYLHVTVYP